jgi:hypothetical protein
MTHQHFEFYDALGCEREFMCKLRANRVSHGRWYGIFQSVFSLNKSQSKTLVISLNFASADVRPTLSIRGRNTFVNIDWYHWSEIISYIQQNMIASAFKRFTTHTVQSVNFPYGNLLKINAVDDAREFVLLGAPTVHRLLIFKEMIEEIMLIYRRRQFCLLEYYVAFIKEVHQVVPPTTSNRRESSYAVMSELFKRDKVRLDSTELNFLEYELDFKSIYDDVRAM